MDDTFGTPRAEGSSSRLDGLLVRLLDGELSGPAEAEARVLLESSSEVRTRLEKIQGSADLFSSRLRDLPIPPTPDSVLPFIVGVPGPTSGAQAPGEGQAFQGRQTEASVPTRRPSIALHRCFYRHRLAAGIVLLLMSLALFRPVRALIAEGARTLFSLLAPTEGPPPSAVELEVGSSRVSFVPVGSEFLVSVRAVQASGQLTVVVVEGPQASGEILGEGAGIDLLVLPGGIEVRNGPGSVGTYSVGVPRSLRQVRVEVAGRDLGVCILDGARVGDSWSFELGPAGG